MTERTQQDKQNEKFRKLVDNMMISLEVFDQDRYNAGEPMIHQDALARYRQILQSILGDKNESL